MAILIFESERRCASGQQSVLHQHDSHKWCPSLNHKTKEPEGKQEAPQMTRKMSKTRDKEGHSFSFENSFSDLTTGVGSQSTILHRCSSRDFYESIGRSSPFHSSDSSSKWQWVRVGDILWARDIFWRGLAFLSSHHFPVLSVLISWSCLVRSSLKRHKNSTKRKLMMLTSPRSVPFIFASRLSLVSETVWFCRSHTLLMTIFLVSWTRNLDLQTSYQVFAENHKDGHHLHAQDSPSHCMIISEVVNIDLTVKC
jgi:hypothetical protein